MALKINRKASAKKQRINKKLFKKAWRHYNNLFLKA